MSQTKIESGFIGNSAVTTNVISDNAVTSNKLTNNSNGKGTRTVSTSQPISSSGSDGDIWYVV